MMIVSMPLEKRMNCENSLALPSEEQPEVCLEHQCSKRYLFSMLQDVPQHEYAFPVPCSYKNADPNNSNFHLQVDSRGTESPQLELGFSKQSTLQAGFISPSLDTLTYIVSSEVLQIPTSTESRVIGSTQNEKRNFRESINYQKQSNDEGSGNSWEVDKKKLHHSEASNSSFKRDVGYMYRKGREMGSRCNCRLSERSLKFHCDFFTDNDRQALFTMFWETMDWHQRKLYVSSLVKCSYPKARRKECQDPHRKEFAFQYHLKKNNKLLRVCKVMFINTFSIGEFSVRDWAMHSAKKSPL